MTLPERKNVRLKEYDYSNPGAYFITLCTDGRKKILSDIIVGDDAYIVPQVKLTQYGEIVEKYIKSIPGIDKYVIMPDHIHLIIIINIIICKIIIAFITKIVNQNFKNLCINFDTWIL